MKLRVALFALLCFAIRDPRVHAADPPAVRPISLTTGKGELLQFDRDIVRVVVAEPRVADAIVVSPHDVMVSAKGPGQTTLVIWETDAPPVQFDINVANSADPIQGMHRTLDAELKSALPGSPIEFRGNDETIVLTGKVASIDDSKRAEAIASAHSRKVVNMLEMPDKRQILLQVKFASVDRVALQQFGMNIFSRNPALIGLSSTQQYQSPLFTQLQFQDGVLGNSNINLSNLLNLFLFRPDLNLGATIQALEQQNLLQILAEPNLIVAEGSAASFLAGGEFPFPTITNTPTSSGVAPVVTVQFRKFGVQLDFTPHGTSTGGINLKVRPEVSALDYTNAVTLQGFIIPAISSRVAETEVVLKDGESFAIAGLIDNRAIQVINRIKGLGDIPVLGNLFRSRSTRKTTDELLVVVTPRFVKPLAPGETADLPDQAINFLPTVAEEQAKKNKQTNGKPESKKPEFVGPRGHEVPR
jgi:pilus assembly protein CpaC